MFLSCAREVTLKVQRYKKYSKQPNKMVKIQKNCFIYLVGHLMGNMEEVKYTSSDGFLSPADSS